MENNKMRGRVKVIDIETSNLLEPMIDHTSFPYKLKPDAKLHVVVIRDVYTNEVFKAEKENITKEWLKETLKGCEILVQHNGVKFDLIALKLFGVLDYTIGYLNESDTLFGQPIKIIDTLILSRLFNPDRYGGHSLESWGERTGSAKMDFRGELIAQGIIPKDSPKGFEFQEFTPLMSVYCEIDTEVNKNTFLQLVEEKKDYDGWERAIKMEHKLADLAIRRETLGFWFDKDLAIKCLEDLGEKMEELRSKVNPKLPPKPMTKGELAEFTPPATQLSKKGEPSHYIKRFADRIGAIIEQEEHTNQYFLNFEGKRHQIPFNYALRTTTEADISNLDHVKSTLIDDYLWVPIEWAERDFTKDAKKQTLTYEKRITAFERWLKETIEGKYKKLRLKTAFENFKVKNVEDLEETVREKLRQDFPVRLPTSPKIRVGVEKDLCPNLTKLGEKVSFAKDFALYLTYKHRRSSIAGGEIEDIDFDSEYPNTGFLSMYREEDGRCSTPSIELGANTGRYRHIGIVNVARASSIYGKEMRSLFGSGKESVFFGFDYSGVEARIMASYVYNYTDGIELGKTFIADKPDDLHCYSEDTEILTKQGWKTFGNINTETYVAQYNPESKNAEWVKPFEVVWQEYEGDMISIKGKNTDQLLTPQHRVYTEDIRSGRGKVDLAKDLLNVGYTDRRFLCGSVIMNSEKSEDSDFLKLLVATQADGCLAKDCSSISFSFVREEKVHRLKSILDSMNAQYSYREYFRKGRYEKIIRLNSSPLTVKLRSYLSYSKELKDNLLDLNYDNRKIIVDEIKYWDGTVASSGIVLDITCEKTINVYQSICASLGIKTTITKFNKKIKDGRCLVHRLFISTKAKCECGIYGTEKSIISYKGKVGCVSVPSTFIIVRRNGKVFVSGNTKMSLVMGVPRSEAKSINYGLIYGASWRKIQKMTGRSDEQSKNIVDGFWNAAPGLKELKEKVLKYWEHTGKKYVPAVDGRKIYVRSPHSILNIIFQSGGVLFAKYITVMLMEKLEKKYNLLIDPFVGKPQVCSMAEVHDEQALYVDPKLLEFKTFKSKEEAKEFTDNWKGEQLGGINEGKKGYYVTLPNCISKSITECMDEVEKLLNIKVKMGMEYLVGRNWYDCH